MRKLTLSASLSLFGLLGLSAFADVTKEELKKLASAGVSEDVILSYIRTNGPVVKLSSDDLIELKQAGLGDRALAAAAAGTAQAAPAPPPAPSQTMVVESVVTPPVTYYSSYERPYLYSPNYSFGYGAYYYPSHSHHYSHYNPSHHAYRGHHGVTHGSHHGRHYGGHSGGHHGGYHGGGHQRGGHSGRH